jgi:tetratricopeptide (TPR) repeat protein
LGIRSCTKSIDSQRLIGTYKDLSMNSASEDSIYLEIADIYLKMGLREEAQAQYRILLREYERLGRKDKILEVMAMMAKMEPNKADPKKKLTGLERVLNLKDKAVGIFQLGKARFLEENLSQKRKEAYFDLEAALAKPEPDGTKKLGNRIVRESL